jgi:hypothetical protein
MLGGLINPTSILPNNRRAGCAPLSSTVTTMQLMADVSQITTKWCGTLPISSAPAIIKYENLWRACMGEFPFPSLFGPPIAEETSDVVLLFQASNFGRR